MINEYALWLHALPQPRMFAACPLGFDGTWIDYYLRRFTPYGPYETDKVFHRAGLCIAVASLASAMTGTSPGEFHPAQLAPALLGDVPHPPRH